MSGCVHCHQAIRENKGGFAVLFNVAPEPVRIHTKCYDAGVRHYKSEEAYESRVREVLSTTKREALTSRR